MKCFIREKSKTKNYWESFPNSGKKQVIKYSCLWLCLLADNIL